MIKHRSGHYVNVLAISTKACKMGLKSTFRISHFQFYGQNREREREREKKKIIWTLIDFKLDSDKRGYYDANKIFTFWCFLDAGLFPIHLGTTWHCNSQSNVSKNGLWLDSNLGCLLCRHGYDRSADSILLSFGHRRRR